MKRNEELKSLREVWEWKDKAYQEVKDLDLKNALRMQSGPPILFEQRNKTWRHNPLK